MNQWTYYAMTFLMFIIIILWYFNNFFITFNFLINKNKKYCTIINNKINYYKNIIIFFVLPLQSGVEQSERYEYFPNATISFLLNFFDSRQ